MQPLSTSEPSPRVRTAPDAPGLQGGATRRTGLASGVASKAPDMAAEAVCAITKLRPDELRDAIKANRIQKPVRGLYDAAQAVNGALEWYRDRLDTPSTIETSELREITGLTDVRHRQLAAEGYFPPPIRGRYQLKPTFMGFVRYNARHREERDRKRAELHDDRMRKENALIDYSLGEKLGTYISVQDMADKLLPGLHSMRQRILASTLAQEERDQLLQDLGSILEQAIKKPLRKIAETRLTRARGPAQAAGKPVG